MLFPSKKTSIFYIFSLFLMLSPFVYSETTETDANVETIDINTADAVNLARVLEGVGEKKAAAIVKFREENGLFKSPEDLIQVYGIGEKTVEKNKDKIMLSEPELTATDKVEAATTATGSTTSSDSATPPDASMD
jgi:competence protein ComEA